MVNIPQKKKVKYLDKKYKKFNSLKKKKNNSKVGTHRVRQPFLQLFEYIHSGTNKVQNTRLGPGPDLSAKSGSWIGH